MLPVAVIWHYIGAPGLLPVLLEKRQLLTVSVGLPKTADPKPSTLPFAKVTFVIVPVPPKRHRAPPTAPLAFVWLPSNVSLTKSMVVLSAWQGYLADHNDGRPIVFIGHSQGAAMLIRLLQSQVDPNSALRARC